MTNLTADLKSRLRLPVFVAPMFLISSPDMVIAAGKAGVIGAFPTPNARTLDDLSAWLSRISRELHQAGRPGLWAVNMIVHRTYERFKAELDLICEFQPRIVITALGNPARVLDRVHAYGGAVFADVVSVEQAQKAVDAGADGLILVASGAGGHTGRYSPLAFVEAVRAFWDGPLVVGGAIGSARGVRAALTMGADFAYMGTRFIATHESLASRDHCDMLVRAGIDDIVPSAAVTGVPANWLRESLQAAGIDPSAQIANDRIEFAHMHGGPKAWKNVWGAGQAVGQTQAVQTVEEIVDELCADYAAQIGVETRTLNAWPNIQGAVANDGDVERGEKHR